MEDLSVVSLGDCSKSQAQHTVFKRGALIHKGKRAPQDHDILHVKAGRPGGEEKDFPAWASIGKIPAIKK